MLAARTAIGDRKGAVVVLDARDGRVRAAVNPEYAWQRDFPIGSVIKLFVASAMLRDGSLKSDEPFTCIGRIQIGQTLFRCSHPRQTEPINLERAIALSCNSYFAHLADRLNIESLRRELRYRGLGKAAGLNIDDERVGKLAPVADDKEQRALTAIGETDAITATPIGLAAATLSLITGKAPLKPYIGNLKSPLIEKKSEPTPDSILIGMRECLEYGTGTKERGWKEFPFTVLGKTGTPTIPGATVTHGWFVGVSIAERGPQSGSPELVVAVFLDRGKGTEAASIAHDVFKAYSKEPLFSSEKIEQSAHNEPELTVSLFDPLRPTELTLWSGAPITFRNEDTDEILLRAPGGIQPLRYKIRYLPDGALRVSGASLNTALRDNRLKISRIKIDADNGDSIEARVGGAMSRRFGSHLIVRADMERRSLLVLEQLGLEKYIAGVVAAEVSEEDKIEALAAQAAAARSYAATLLESSKHSFEGFDLCSSTHCQRYAGRSAGGLVERAVDMTRGEVLTVGVEKPQILRALFHACCGGRTKNPKDLWPSTPDQISAEGVIDNACAASDHRAWTRSYRARDVFSALEKMNASEVDEEIASISSISLEEADGKTARRVRVEDARGGERFVYPADFTVAMGRALGWNACPSPPELIRREGDRIIIEGRGLGHGAGLCQHGAHAMAAEGKTWREIVAHFYREARVLRIADCGLRIDQGGSAPNQKPAIASPQLSNERSNNPQSAIRNPQLKDGAAVIDYAPPNRMEDAKEIAQLIAEARSELDRVILISSAEEIRVKIYGTTANFIEATGLSGNIAGSSKNGVIHLQPAQLLKKRGVFRETVRHEYAHCVIAMIGGPAVSRWFQEGMAARIAGEGGTLDRERDPNKPLKPTSELECALIKSRSNRERRALYAEAYAVVMKLIEKEGERKVWQNLKEGRYKTSGC